MTGTKRPTLHDVANEAGVSFKTVSRVVNNEPGVSVELTNRVRIAVDKLGYRPDHRARILRRSTSASATIGVIHNDVSNPFFSAILRGVEDVAADHGHLVISGSTDGKPQRELQLIGAFIERRVDGLILTPTSQAMVSLRPELDRGAPIVFIDLEPGEEVTTVDVVRSDHRQGSELAVGHLIANGHRRIALLADDPVFFSARLRIEGYQTTLAEAGIEPDPALARVGTGDRDRWHQIALDLLTGPSPPTAVFAAQNFITEGTIRALRQQNLQREVALVGFDEIDFGDLLDPGITVIPQNPRRLGREAATILFSRLEGCTEPPIRKVLSLPIIARGSGEILPGPLPT